ncbi:MAG: hypothetical protein ALAOOOJD_04104 [bacterium]|nr:hypothetical protein [bacterium]
MPHQSNILYRENQPMVSWVILLLLFVFASNFAVLLLLSSVPQMPVWPKLLLAAVMAALSVMMWTFRRLSIELTETDISFGFALIRKRLRWQDVESVEEVPYLFSRFIGWGIRYDMRGTFGFIARSGMGVQIQTRNRWRYFISTNHPQELLNLAKTQIKQAHARA